jgi:MFS family permease
MTGTPDLALTASTVAHRREARPIDQRKIRRAGIAALIGTMLENYDFVIYGTASALVFSKVFFPSISPQAALIASFGAYAVGFVARPIGGLFFSHFGERLGRKWTLVATLLLMGGSTFAIGCLPTYETLGIWAPLLLVILRFFQGFGAGAEQAGGATLLTETAPLGKRGRLASLVQVGAALGVIAGSLTWIGIHQFSTGPLESSWEWRWVFWSSIVVTLTALIIRRTLSESPVFDELRKEVDVEHRAPLRGIAQHGLTNVFKVILMTWGVSTQSYTYQVFMMSYLVTVVGVQASLIPPLQLVASVFAMVAAYLAGLLSDWYGRRSMTLLLNGALIVTPFIVFPGLNTGSPLLIVGLIIFGYMFVVQGVPSIQMSFLPEMFGNRYRYAGVTLGREFASIIGGGVAPLVCASLLAWSGNGWLPVALYMAFTMLVSFVATWTVPETLDRDLNDPADAL